MTDHFIPTGMRTKIPEQHAGTALVINTCAGNDTTNVGDLTAWAWASPTNRAYPTRYADVEAVSVEALWQGTKIRAGMTEPDPAVLAGDWRRAKGRTPIGAWAGAGNPLITTPGGARRAIYIPAYRNQIESWLRDSHEARLYLRKAREFNGPVFLRDFDTGKGIDRNGPMSHAWLFSIWLNTGEWPS